MVDEYRLVRDVFGWADQDLAAIAHTSVLASGAPPALKKELSSAIDDWITS